MRRALRRRKHDDAIDRARFLERYRRLDGSEIEIVGNFVFVASHK